MAVDISRVGGLIKVTEGSDDPFYGQAEDCFFEFNNVDTLSFNVRKSFSIKLSDLTIEGIAPADKTAALTALEELFPEANTSSGGTGTTSDGRASGIDVIWQGGLDFLVTPGTYYRNGSLLNFAGGEVTLDDGDETNPRIDVIALNSVTGEAAVVEGEPAADPAEPTVDAETYIKLTTVLINAEGTEPANVSNDQILYNENLGTGGGEWNISGTVTRDANATNKVLVGSKSIRVTAGANNTYIQFTAAGDLNVADYDKLIIPINLNSALSGNLTATFYRGSTAVSSGQNATNRGLTLTTVNQWQYIVFDLAVYQFTSSIFNAIRILKSGAGTVNFNLDQIRLQKGGGQAVSGNYLPKFFDADQLVNVNGKNLKLSTFLTLILEGRKTDLGGPGNVLSMSRTGTSLTANDHTGADKSGQLAVNDTEVSMGFTDNVDSANSSGIRFLADGMAEITGAPALVHNTFGEDNSNDYTVKANDSIIIIDAPTGADRDIIFPPAGGSGRLLEIHITSTSAYNWQVVISGGTQLNDADGSNVTELLNNSVYQVRCLLGRWKIVSIRTV